MGPTEHRTQGEMGHEVKTYSDEYVYVLFNIQLVYRLFTSRLQVVYESFTSCLQVVCRLFTWISIAGARVCVTLEAMEKSPLVTVRWTTSLAFTMATRFRGKPMSFTMYAAERKPLKMTAEGAETGVKVK